MSDLTSPEVYYGFFSAFWSRFFGDSVAMRGVAHADALDLAQQYQNFLEAVGNLSIHTIEPFHKKQWLPIVLRRSSFGTGPDQLKHGSGANFGVQPADTKFREGVTFTYGGLEQRSGLYYVGAPANLQNLGAVITNRLVEPSVMLVRDSGFIFGDGIITFKDDPFENPLIPKREVAGANGNVEEEIVLWAIDGEFDDGRLHEQYGYLFSNRKVSSESYRKVIAAFMALFSDGPTPQMLEAIVATVAGQPVIREVSETVERVTTLGTKQIVITDASTYQVSTSVELRPEVVPGAVLLAGTPLTTVAQAFDYTRTPNWWTTVPAIAAGRDYIFADISPLGFVNTVVPVELEPTLDLLEGTATPARFFLTGKTEDIEKFWSLAREKTAAGAGLGDLLWKDAGLVDGDGAPDFTQELYINPLEFLVKKILGRHLIVIKMKVNLITRSESFLDLLKILKNTIPVWCSLLVIFEVTLEEEFAFQNAGEPTLDATNLVATEDLIAGAPENFTGAADGFWNDVDSEGAPVNKTPEALSDAISPETITTTLDLATPGNNVTAYGGSTAVLEESVHYKLTDACTP